MGKIIAIGGGRIGGPKEDGSGHYETETTLIDQEIIKLTGKKNPRLLVIPTASYESLYYSLGIRDQFLRLGCSEVNVLTLSRTSLTKAQIKEMILSHDAIYVGGGNTLRMMRIWKKWGIDKALKEAHKKGIVLSGLSAGSICWFTYGNSDSRSYSSGSNQLIKVSGLGLIDALHCPHYNSEAARQADLKRMMKQVPKVAIALDDCTALEVVDDTYQIIKSKPTAKAHKIYWKQNEYIIEELPASNEFHDLQELLSLI